VADLGLLFEGGGGLGGKVQKVQKLVAKLAKHSVKQRETTAIPLPPRISKDGRYFSFFL